MRAAFRWVQRSPWRVFTVTAAVICVISGVLYAAAPEFVGTLTNQAQTYFSKEAPVPCLGLDKRPRSICWNNEIHAVLKGSGIVPALALLETFSRTFPDFANECHSYAHLIGEEAYRAFRIGTPVPASRFMQLCDFGFFHGFMTTFTTESRDPREMSIFCNQMEGTAEDEKSYSRNACFHGIGHGSVERHSAAEWRNPDVVLQQTLRLCRAAATDENDYRKCAGGVYDGMVHGTYGAEILDKRDPFKLCRGLTEEDVPAECYANIAGALFNFTKNHTLKEALLLVNSYDVRPQYFQYVVGMFAALAARESDSPQAVVATCATLSSELSYTCIWGYATALVQIGVPDSKQAHAYVLCSSKFVPETIRKTCFEASFSQLSDFWSKEKIGSSCSLAPLRGKVACKEALDVWLNKNTP